MYFFVYIPIIIFTILLFIMSNKQGTQSSISQLAKKQWFILSLALCCQLFLVYPMIEITPVIWKFLPFIGCSAIIFTGITNIFNKEDEVVHIISAIIAFISFTLWVFIIKYQCLISLILCIAAGKQNLKWRIEVGLIISVYTTLLLMV